MAILVLVEKLQNGETTEIPLENAQTLTAQPGASYSVVDGDTMQPPEGLKLRREGTQLEVEVNDEVIARLDDFFVDSNNAVFRVDGSAGAGTVIDSTTGSADGIVWQASEVGSSSAISGVELAAAHLSAGLGLNVINSGRNNVNDGSSSPPPPPSGDTTAPDAPLALDLEAGSDTGSTDADNLTSDTTPTISGTAEANSTVTLISSVDGTVGTATADGSGNWSITASTLSEGGHDITATATDAAGNTSAASSALAITIDTSAPLAPSTPDMMSADDSGSSNSDNVTQSTTPTFSGTAEANSTVTLMSSVDGIVGTATTSATGHWDITASALSEGGHDITATATDAAGNASPASPALAITVDTTNPSIDTLVVSGDDVVDGSDTLTAVAFSGTTMGVEDGQSVIVSVGGGIGVIATVTGNAFSGTVDLSAVADGGGIAVTGDVSDEAGNAATQFTSSIVKNTEAPTVDSIVRQNPTDATTNADSVTFRITFSEAVQNVDTTDFSLSGTAAGDGTVNSVTPVSASVYDVAITGVTNSNGTINLDVAGGHDIQDSAGTALANTTPTGVDETYTMDNVAPASPSAPDLDAGSDTGSSSADNLTNDTTPTFTGTAEANSTVTVISSVDGTLGSTVADGSGNWSFTPGSALTAATHNITATATDAAGNTGAASAALSITVDTAAPSIDTLVVSGDDVVDTGDTLSAVAFNGTTSGVEDGQSITVDVGGVSTAVTVTGNAFNGTLDLSGVADSNSVPVTGDVSDVAGNAATQFTNTITVDVDPKINSATYNAATGVLVVTGSNIQANSGGADIDVSTLTFTGEGGTTYTLTDSSDVERDSVSQFTVTLSAADKAEVNQILNKDGASSTGGTTYNLAAADDWDTNVTAGDTSDTTGNGITVSNVAAPTISGATYDAGTGLLVVTGTGFLKASGAANDIDVSLLTFTGQGGGGSSYTLTDSSDVEITNGTSFTVALSAADQVGVNAILNKDGASAKDATTYNLAAAEDWAAGADAAVVVADLTGNGITVSGVNDDPTIANLPTDITVTEDTASNVDLSAATFSDPDSGANSITLTLSTASGGTLVASSGGGVTVSGSGSGTLTLSGTAGAIDTFLNTASNIQYTGPSNVNGGDVDTITLTANDGGFTGVGGGGNVVLDTVNVDITAVNDAPVVANVNGDSVSVEVGSGLVNIDQNGDASVTDIDSSNFNGGDLTISQASGTANGNFSVDGTNVTSGGDATIAAGETIAVGGVSIGTVDAVDDGQGGNNLVINFNSTDATAARISTLAQNLTYDAPSGLGARTFNLTVTDGDGGSETSTAATFTVNVVDTTAPTLSSSTPADNATGVALDADIVLDFNENIALGTGDIVISDGSQTITIDVASHGGQLSIVGSQLTINPSVDLANNSANYNVQIDSTAITDISGNAYAGIADTTTLDFTTVAPPNTSIVVFDLRTGAGTSSDHDGGSGSSRTFSALVEYDIYIVVNSNSLTVIEPTSKWQGGLNLGSDDTIHLVGDGSPILGFNNGPINLVTVSGFGTVSWVTTGGNIAGAFFSGVFLRRYGGAATPTVPLFTSGPLTNSTTFLATIGLTTLPASIASTQVLS